LVCVVALYDVGDGGFDDGDVGGGARFGAQLGDEAAVVEGAAFGRLGRSGGDEVVRVGDVDLFGVVVDLVAVAGDGVDVIEAVWEVLVV
jgi:hypothetical protein